jgi:hypothetical protein
MNQEVKQSEDDLSIDGSSSSEVLDVLINKEDMKNFGNA